MFLGVGSSGRLQMLVVIQFLVNEGGGLGGAGFEGNLPVFLPILSFGVHGAHVNEAYAHPSKLLPFC